LLPWQVAAQAPPATPIAADQRVEISAQPVTDTELRRRDPVAKTIFGRDELEKYGDLSVADALKRLPGVTMQGGSPRLRGLGAGYTLVLINGEPAPPGFSLDTLAPSQVERIELTRGPSADQSAQAVAGTVNIVLREAPRQRQRELRLTLGYNAQRPVLSGNGSWGDRVGDGAGALSYTVPLSVYQWRGLADTTSLRQATDTAGAAQTLNVVGDDNYWGDGFNLGPRLSWKLGSGNTLSWQTFAQHHRFNNQGRQRTAVLLGQPPISVDDRFTSGGFWQLLRSGLQWQGSWADGSKLDLRGGGQVTRSRSRNHTDGLDGAGALSLVRETTGANHEHSWTSGGKLTRPLGEAHTLAAGWDLESRSRTEQRSVVENGQQQLVGVDGQPFDATLQRSALFVQDDWEIAPLWSTSLGLRAERINTTSTGKDAASGVDVLQRNTSQVLTPIWHLSHKLDARGRDLLRASLTRSYKAPDLSALMARPSINSLYPVDGPNPQIAPDRIGNPGLRPELAVGLDLAFEHYLAQGGVVSIGGFHRDISGLIRNQVTLQAVPWSTVPRWVSQPVNLAHARSAGLEIEVKGRADELFPAVAAAPAGLSLRASLSAYRSQVDGLPRPDNRLEQQQPWSATAGFDHKLTALPLTLGASLAFTPGYTTQQTELQRNTQGRVRALDVYALWTLDRQTSLRLAANNLLADGSRNLTTVQPTDGPTEFTLNTRSQRRSVNASLQCKF
jgi:iron complex outermembrane receptor protein